MRLLPHEHLVPIDFTRNMAQQSSPFQPGALTGNLLLCFGLWIIVGAIGFSSWPSSSDTDLSFSEVALLTVIPAIYITILIVVNTQYSFHPSPQVSSRAIFIVAMVCFCLTAALCILTSGSRNLFQDYFWMMGSTFAGGACEIFTGFMTRYMGRLESTQSILV